MIKELFLSSLKRKNIDPYYNLKLYVDKNNVFVFVCCDGWSWEYYTGIGFTKTDAIKNMMSFGSMYDKNVRKQLDDMIKELTLIS